MSGKPRDKNELDVDIDLDAELDGDLDGDLDIDLDGAPPTSLDDVLGIELDQATAPALEDVLGLDLDQQPAAPPEDAIDIDLDLEPNAAPAEGPTGPLEIDLEGLPAVAPPSARPNDLDPPPAPPEDAIEIDIDEPPAEAPPGALEIDLEGLPAAAPPGALPIDLDEAAPDMPLADIIGEPEDEAPSLPLEDIVGAPDEETPELPLEAIIGPPPVGEDLETPIEPPAEAPVQAASETPIEEPAQVPVEEDLKTPIEEPDEEPDEEFEDEFEPIGSLIDNPLPVLLMQLFKAGLSGTLHLEGADLKTWVHFDRGRPDGVQDPNSEIFLGMVLREQGVLSDQDFNASLMKMAETKQLQGEVLMEMGAITRAQLDKALRTQLIRKTAQLFKLQSATYRFEEDASMPTRTMAHPISPYPVLYNGLHNCYSNAELDAFLVPLAGKLCGAGPKLADFIAVIDLPEDERTDLDLLAQHRSPDDFANRAQSGKTSARMLLLSLYWSGMLMLTDPDELKAPEPAPRPRRPRPAAPRPAEPRPKPKPKPEAKQKPAPKPSGPKVPPTVMKRLEAKHKQANQNDLPGLLGVKDDAGPGEVKAAFAGLAKVFHPDRFAKFDDPALTEKVALVAAKLNEAFDTLSDPDKRKAYLATRAATTSGASRPITMNPEAAAKAYEKAKHFLNRKDLRQALSSMRTACRLNPTEITYRARLAWLEYAVEPEPDETHKKKLKRALEKLRKQTPSNFWVNRLLATACQLLGETDEYESYLQKAHGIRPKDVDTAREVRLLQMRKEKEAKGGLFGKRKG